MMDYLVKHKTGPLLQRIGIILTVFVILSILYQFQVLESIPRILDGFLASNFQFRRELKEDGGGGEYLVKTVGCSIYSPDPFDPSALPFIIRNYGNGPNCSYDDPRQPPVLALDGRLRINPKFVPPSASPYGQYWGCCFRSIERVTEDPQNYTKYADNHVILSADCQEIPGPTNPNFDQGILVTVQFIQIECQFWASSESTGSWKVEKEIFDFHATIFPPQKQSVETKEKVQFWENFDKKKQPDKKVNFILENGETNFPPSRPPNVLIIGVDSTSRLHMIRSMPETRKFLKKNDFIEMKGYTKIGLNTFPNVMGILTGLNEEHLGTLPCWPTRSVKGDDCPFIWKNFSSDHYVTALVEDSPSITMFNYLKVGFVSPPVDYYFRPIAVAYEKRFGPPWKNETCLAGEAESDFLLKYLNNFLDTMSLSGGGVPYFLLSWLTSLTHDDFNGLQTADSKFRKLLTKATMDDNTVTLFISDHGYRYGPFRETFLGYYEDSLPFFYIRLPPWLKKWRAEWYQNLKLNSQKLTTPLDVHSSLKDILTLSQNLGKDIKLISLPDTENDSENNYDRVQYSFFERIPSNRTCASATISQKYCRCGLTPTPSLEMEMGKDTLSKLTQVVVDEVNSLHQRDIRIAVNCAVLKFNKILYGRQLGVGEEWDMELGKFTKFVDHLLALELVPLATRFEATVRLFETGKAVVRNKIERINRYAGGQSDCVGDPELKSFCVCKNFLQQSMAIEEEEEE